MEVLILAALIGLIPAAIAKNKGRSFGLWWLYGAALFIVALPHALLARTLNEGVERHQREAGLTKCPYCAEFVKGEAVVCKHCGHALLLKSDFAPEVHAHPALAGIDTGRACRNH